MMSGLVSMDSLTTPILREAMVLRSDGEAGEERMPVCAVTPGDPHCLFVFFKQIELNSD